MTDEQAVARLEALIHSQPPAKPWTPVTDYSFDARKAIEGQHPQLIQEVFRPWRVADIGCGPGHLVRLLRERGVLVDGFDKHGGAMHWTYDIVDDPPAYYVSQRGLYHVGQYDLVICREVLEHLTIRDVAQAVRNLVKLSSKYVYVTTRYAKAPDHLLAVDTSDDLDPTHCTMLTKPFLRTLFVLEGCKSRPDLEAKMDWKGLGRCLVFEVA